MKKCKLSNGLINMTEVRNSKKIFFFPFAGGSASYYFKFADFFNLENIETIAIQLPGRENRYFEEKLYSIDDMALSIFEELSDHLTEEYYFFGHSMGGILIYEVLKLLKSKNYTWRIAGWAC